MSREIYNKNAREKALLEEAYGNVYNEDVLNESPAWFRAGKEALKAGADRIKDKLKDKIKDKAQKKAASRLPKPDKKDVEQFKNQPRVTSGSSRTPKDVSPPKNVKKPGVGDKVEDWMKKNPGKTTAIGGTGAVGGTATIVAPKVGEMVTDKSGLGEPAALAGQGVGAAKALADAANDALPESWGFNVGKWAIPAAVVGGGYLLAKSLSKDKDKDKEESEEGGGLRAAEQEMIQRAQAGEDPHAALDEVAGNHGVDKETLKKAIFGESKIYNKNAREKSLLEEAYVSVYREDTDKEKRYEDRWDKDLDKEKEKEGSSSAGDYSDVDKDDFCGPAGGAAPGTYPVNSEKRARAALSYAHNAPDPEGIKRCVYRKAKKHGWFEEPEDEENPDAHTYSNLGREPGPAAELNPNIGFDEDEEAVNENLLDKIQDGLSYVGMLPAAGIPVDLGNAVISAARGKWGDAALNTAAAVPVLGWGAGGKRIGSKIADAAKGRHLADASRKKKIAAFGTEVGKDVLTPAQSYMDPGIQLRDLNPANWSQPKTGAPSRAAILQGKGPKPTKQQLHAKGIPTMSPVSDEEVSVGAEVMFDGMMKSGQVEEVDLENGVAVVVDEDGGEHIVDLDNFDVVLNP